MARKKIFLPVVLVLLALVSWQCARIDKEKNTSASGEQSKEAAASDFAPYAIQDSSAIVTYPNGLKIYIVREGPGEFARDGMNIRMNYHGILETGEVFDSSFRREEPFFFTMGQTPIIAGLYQAVQKMRLGSQAVVIVPPELGYSNRKERPANIPESSTLVFHIDLLGSF